MLAFEHIATLSLAVSSHCLQVPSPVIADITVFTSPASFTWSWHGTIGVGIGGAIRRGVVCSEGLLYCDTNCYPSFPAAELGCLFGYRSGQMLYSPFFDSRWLGFSQRIYRWHCDRCGGQYRSCLRRCIIASLAQAQTDWGIRCQGRSGGVRVTG